MREYLMVLLSLSLSGAVLTLLLSVLNTFCRKWLPKSWIYYIWGLVALRMLLPFTPEQNLMNLFFRQLPAVRSETAAAVDSGFSLMDNRAENTDASGGNGTVPADRYGFSANGSGADRYGSSANGSGADRYGSLASGSGADGYGSSASGSGADGYGSSASGSGADGYGSSLNGAAAGPSIIAVPAGTALLPAGPASLLFGVWITIFLLLLSRKIFLSVRCARRIRSQAQPVRDPSVLALYRESCNRLAVRSAPALFTVQNADTPMLVGLWRTFIAIPEKQLQSVEKLSLIFRHELIHYKRRDVLYNWLFQLVSCLHFFNPAVYIVRRQVTRACELSCDAAVVKDMDRDEIIAYGDTLLDAAALRHQTPQIPAASISLCENAKFLKERLTEMKTTNKKTKATAALTFLLSVIVCFGTFYIGAYAAPSESAKQSQPVKPQTTSKPAPSAHSVETPDPLPVSQTSAAGPQTEQPAAAPVTPQGYTALKDETLPLNAVTSLNVLLSYEKVTVFPAQDQTVRMIFFGKDGMTYQPQNIAVLQSKNGILSVESGEYDQKWSKLDSKRWQPQIYLYLPASFSGALRMEIGSGSLLASTPFTADSAAFSAGSGSMKLMEIAAAKRCELTSSSGKLETASITGNTCSIVNHSGSFSTGPIQAQQTCEISNSSGKFKAGAVSGTNCLLSNISGQFRLTGPVTANLLEFANQSGHASVGSITADRFALETGSGQMDIQALSGHGSAIAGSGDISADLFTLNGSLDITVGSGSFTAAMDKNASLRLDGTMGSGSISAFFPLSESDSGHATTGRTGKTPYNQIKADAASGYISLTQQ